MAQDDAKRAMQPGSENTVLSSFDPSRCRLERYDRISSRIIDERGTVVAIAEQLSNGRWIVTVGGKRQGPWSCKTPRAAFLTWRNKAIATEARRAETVEQGSVHEGAGPEDIAHD